jgi:hypothetical protein
VTPPATIIPDLELDLFTTTIDRADLDLTFGPEI